MFSVTLAATTFIFIFLARPSIKPPSPVFGPLGPDNLKMEIHQCDDGLIPCFFKRCVDGRLGIRLSDFCLELRPLNGQLSAADYRRGQGGCY